jgi:acyl-coenzyme A thioesterase PaaI-like protein
MFDIMTERGDKHKGCYFCDSDSFLFSNYSIDRQSIQTEMKIGLHHQGWPGIPHGGVGMTSFFELADLLHEDTLQYPLMASFRFGGERLFIGDSVILRIEREGNLFTGVMVKKSGGAPYLTCTIESPACEMFTHEIAGLNELIRRPVVSSSPLVMPNFANRLVYTSKSQEFHKYRTFKFKEIDNEKVYMKCIISDRQGNSGVSDINRLSEGQLHPGALITILDETLGWAGFFSAWQGGVTVNISTYFLRSVRPSDNIFSIGTCDDTYGSYSRKMVFSSGGLFAKTEGAPELVAYATGKWLTKPEYKEKMLRFIGSYTP